MFTIRSISSTWSIQILKIKDLHCPLTFQQQYRTIKLFTYTTTPSKVGLQKLTEYNKFIISDPESCQVQLIDSDSIEYPPSSSQNDKKPTIANIKPNPTIKKTNLKWVLENHIQHGTFLAPRENRHNSNQYYLQKISEEEITKPIPASRGLKSAPGGYASARRVKLFPFHPTHDWHHIQKQLRIARAWLQSSKRAVVEIHVCLDRKKHAIKNEEEIRRIPDKCLHLRPDVIVKAMPEGTQITIKPQTNGGEYCWVMSRHKGECESLSARFENKKKLEIRKQRLLLEKRDGDGDELEDGIR
ncbi:hypothetical protein OCU04_008011 [Sclerotinia nivalis]|uniref:Uncharacterized protein n=1 Tax=Sclerotinia nivalis TaxID=352851 RepID=A0A9X0AH72_9HELO|nr:hypothetical protein OCU04_008011 [Sclerotinia nivalis]